MIVFKPRTKIYFSFCRKLINARAMKRVKLHDKEFEQAIPHEEIQRMVERVADKINADFGNKGNVVFLSVLNGSFMFTSDLVKNIDFICEVSFVKLSSYQGTSTTGDVKELIGLTTSLKGKCVIVVEDIVDTGITLEKLYAVIQEHQPEKICVATFFFKPESYKKTIKIDYIGKEIPNDFVVGYGLDYDELGRNLKDVYTLVSR